MKIGVLTFWDTKNNYGQVLQALALQQYLKKNGHEPYLIRLYRTIESKDEIVSVPKKVTFKKVLNILFNLNDYLRKKRDYYKTKFEVKNDPRAFEEFKKVNFSYSDQLYTSLEELIKNPPKAGAYICGSDQVWNDTFPLSCEPYLLPFGKTDTRRIAYAASFGVKQLTEQGREIFKRYLHKFDSISVREISGLEICKELGYSDAEFVIDPTLLFNKNEWNNLLKINSSSVESDNTNNAFVYTLGHTIINDKDEFIRYASENSSSEMYHVSSNHDFSGNQFPDVKTWVQKLQSSKFVITNSFHGIVFCIIYHKKFIALPRAGKSKEMNERLTSLLGMLGLEEQIMDKFDANKLDILLAKEIDWDKIDELINKKAKLAKNYLSNALSCEV